MSDSERVLALALALDPAAVDGPGEGYRSRRPSTAAAVHIVQRVSAWRARCATSAGPLDKRGSPAGLRGNLSTLQHVSQYEANLSLTGPR